MARMKRTYRKLTNKIPQANALDPNPQIPDEIPLSTSEMRNIYKELKEDVSKLKSTIPDKPKLKVPIFEVKRIPILPPLPKRDKKTQNKLKRQIYKEYSRRFFKSDLGKKGVAEACQESLLNTLPPVVINKIQTAIRDPVNISKNDSKRIEKIFKGIDPQDQKDALDCAIKNKRNKILTRKNEYSKLFKQYINRYTEFRRKPRQKKNAKA